MQVHLLVRHPRLQHFKRNSGFDMSNRILLKTSAKKCVNVTQGETCRITCVFKDFDGTAFIAADILSLTVTIKDIQTDSVIDGIDAVNILSSLETDGTLKYFVPRTANINVGTEVGQIERHSVLFEWSWNDGAGIRYGAEEFELWLLATEVAPA